MSEQNLLVVIMATKEILRIYEIEMTIFIKHGRPSEFEHCVDTLSKLLMERVVYGMSKMVVTCF